MKKSREENDTSMSTGLAPRLVAVVAAVAFAAVGCEVTNPGPAKDEFLNSEEARPAVVNGMIRALSDAVSGGCGSALTRQQGAVAREIFPAGNTGSCGITVNEAVGILRPDEQSGIWNVSQNARWVAEDGIRRFRETMESSQFQSSELVAEAHLWAGFSNRVMGENFCRAVIDGGEAQPHTVFFERAEQFFSDGLTIARQAGSSRLEKAALAGRAQVRLLLGNYSGAATDAGAVPKGFEFELPFSDVSQAQRNTLWWSQQSTPYRTITVWNTPNWQYYDETGDPRVPWTTDPNNEFGDAAREIVGGRVRFLKQQKYTSGAAPIDLADGREMILIRAEVRLQNGNRQGAMNLINELRTDVGMNERQADSMEEAWRWLKAERRIELWLETRRLGDLRRWEESGTPGALHPLEDASNPDTFLEGDRDLCFPIPDSEINTNPNVGG